ncbi:MAG TPA: GNAT family N-acetyltransferase [Actinocrinis sp.]|jgi:ribosomal protein S18 acetylase RimI-like enzyme
MRVRTPLPEDAPALGRLHAAAWHAAYTGHMPQDFLDTITAERRTEGWRRRLAAQRAEREWIGVAETDQGVAGFVHTGVPLIHDGDAGAAAEVDAETGELYAINVGPEQWGSGAGSALMAAALDALADAGFRRAVLWVLPANDRARRFYERRGWAADGADRQITMAAATIPEVRYARELDR